MPKDSTEMGVHMNNTAKGQDLCGLIVKLGKDILWSEHRGTVPVLGYFDYVEFQQIHHWLQFSPRTTAVGFQNGTEGNPLSMYPIKLIFPKASVVNHLEESVGLSYTSWMGNLSELLMQYPCVTILLVNLTDEFKGKIPRDPCGAQLERLARTIQEGQFLLPGEKEPAAFNPAMAKDAHLCIMPSLGYSDYCILLAEKTWSFASALVEFLHRAAYAESGSREAVPLLSTDYVIPAYRAIGGRVRDDVSQPELQLSIRIHLRPGKSMLDLMREAGEDVEVYQLSGSSDYVLVSKDEGAFRRLLDTAVTDCRSSGEAIPIRTLVVSTEATLLRPIRMLDTLSRGEVSKIEPSDQVGTQIGQLRKILQNYWTLLDRKNRHMRQFNSIWERVTSIESICKEPHNKTLQEIMASWLDAFADCLDRCVGQIAHFDKTGADQDTVQWWMDYVDDVLDAFGREAGSLLADLSRSDCFSMEGERYNHASVSSATSLLIAYNRWQNDFVNAVLSEDPDNRCKYVFLVRSGGCDSTTTNNIFYSLKPELETISGSRREVLVESMPLITQMSEMSLFDCGGTVLRMTHECMHYCGERLRRPRLTHIIDFAARCFATEIARFLFSPEGYPEHILAELKSKFLPDDANLPNADLSNAVFQVWENCSERLRRAIAAWLADNLSPCNNTERRDWTEQNYMSEDLRQWMIDKLIVLFSPYRCSADIRSFGYSAFAEFLYEVQTKTVREFYKGCDAVVRSYCKELTYLSLDCRRLEGAVKDTPLRQSIIWVLNQLFMDPIYETGTSWALQKKGLIDILEKVVFDCFSECYADIEACMRLEAELPDYLLGFVFEEWDIESAIPMDAPFSFRIPAVLRVCFGGQLERHGTALKTEAEDALKSAVHCLAGYGMPETRQNAEQLISRINELLDVDQVQEWIAEPLERYLQECREDYRKQPHPNMEKYQAAFRQIRLLAGGGDSGNVAKLFTNLITIGEVSGNGDPSQPC